LNRLISASVNASCRIVTEICSCLRGSVHACLRPLICRICVCIWMEIYTFLFYFRFGAPSTASFPSIQLPCGNNKCSFLSAEYFVLLPACTTTLPRESPLHLLNLISMVSVIASKRSTIVFHFKISSLTVVTIRLKFRSVVACWCLTCASTTTSAHII